MGRNSMVSVDVSVVIVNYNTTGLLNNCIASVYEKTKRVTFEIIVVDNNSSDNSIYLIQGNYPGVLLIPLDENIGFGRANNEAALRASGKYLFFLNSDTYVRNDAISLLFDYMELNPKCGICGGNLTDFSGSPIHSFDRQFPGPFSDIFLLFRRLPRLLYGKNWCYNYTDSPLRVAYITGADMMISRDLFSGIKGFDPFFFMYYEETELTVRVKNKGYQVCSIPGAHIAHKKGASLQYNAGVDGIFYRSKYYYIKKVYGIYRLYMAHLFFMLVCFLKISGFKIRNKSELKKRYHAIVVVARAAFNDVVT
jgi:GT2 family glycosyltransferase